MNEEPALPLADAWPLLVGDHNRPGLLAAYSVAVLGPAGSVVIRCGRDSTVQVFTVPGEHGPDLAALVRGAVQHLHSYHPELFTPTKGATTEEAVS